MSTTITGLPAASALTGSEVLPLDQAGTTVKATVEDVAAHVGRPFDLSVFYPGTVDAFASVMRYTFARGVGFPSGWTGSAASAGMGATAETILTIYHQPGGVGEAVEIGTVTFDAASFVGSFAGSGASVDAGDALMVFGPGEADVTLTDVAITLAGTR